MKVDRDIMTKNLEKYSDGQIEKFIEQYYKGERVEDIITGANIAGVTQKGFIKALPRLIFGNKCKMCRDEMRTKLLSRGSGNRSFDICLNCGHKESVDHSEISNIIDDGKAHQLIEEDNNYENIKQADFNSLNFSDKTLLAAVMWNAEFNDDNEDFKLNGKAANLLPFGDDGYSMFRAITDKGYLLCSPNSAIEAFNFKNQKISSYFIDKVFYRINISNAKYEDLLFSKYSDNDSNIKNFYECWLNVGISAISGALNEIYLKSDLEELNVDAKKFGAVAGQCLRSFSIGSSITLLKEALYEDFWRSQREADLNFSDLFSRRIEDAIIEGRDVQPDNDADSYCSCWWADVLFYKITTLGVKAYTLVPNLDISFAE